MVQGLGFMVWLFRVTDLWLWVYGLGFRVYGLGFRVEGLWFKV